MKCFPFVREKKHPAHSYKGYNDYRLSKCKDNAIGRDAINREIGIEIKNW